MLNTNYTKLGQEVFFVNWFGEYNIERCTLISIGSENNGGYVKVHHNGTVDCNGELIAETCGESFVRESELFLTLKEAVAYITKSETERFNRYKENIKNLKDLLEFPVKYSFTDGDGCQDGIIVKAYTERAYELTGIEIQI